MSYTPSSNYLTVRRLWDILSSFKTKIATALGGKQDTLTTQTAYTSKGSATKVPQITTNTLGQVTGITEVTISGVTPSAHAVSTTTYGVGSSSNYGHVKLYDSVANENTDGAPTQNAVHDALADKQDSLGIDPTSGDDTKFLNEKGQFTVPAQAALNTKLNVDGTNATVSGLNTMLSLYEDGGDEIFNGDDIIASSHTSSQTDKNEWVRRSTTKILEWLVGKGTGEASADGVGMRRYGFIWGERINNVATNGWKILQMTLSGRYSTANFKGLIAIQNWGSNGVNSDGSSEAFNYLGTIEIFARLNADGSSISGLSGKLVSFLPNKTSSSSRGWAVYAKVSSASGTFTVDWYVGIGGASGKITVPSSGTYRKIAIMPLLDMCDGTSDKHCVHCLDRVTTELDFNTAPDDFWNMQKTPVIPSAVYSLGSTSTPVYIGDDMQFHACTNIVANKVGYVDGNEFNLANVPTSGNYFRHWFNYHNGDTNSSESTYKITEYKFGNRAESTDGVYLVAEGFQPRIIAGSNSDNVIAFAKFTCNNSEAKKGFIHFKCVFLGTNDDDGMGHIDITVKIRQNTWHAVAAKCVRVGGSGSASYASSAGSMLYWENNSSSPKVFYIGVNPTSFNAKVSVFVQQCDLNNTATYTIGDFNSEVSSLTKNYGDTRDVTRPLGAYGVIDAGQNTRILTMDYANEIAKVSPYAPSATTRSHTKWIAAAYSGGKFETCDAKNVTVGGNTEFRVNTSANNEEGLGGSSPASDAKTYLDALPNPCSRAVYNQSGAEFTELFSKSNAGNYGSVLKWGYTTPSMKILRRHSSKWYSENDNVWLSNETDTWSSTAGWEPIEGNINFTKIVSNDSTNKRICIAQLDFSSSDYDIYLGCMIKLFSKGANLGGNKGGTLTILLSVSGRSTGSWDIDMSILSNCNWNLPVRTPMAYTVDSGTSGKVLLMFGVMGSSGLVTFSDAEIYATPVGPTSTRVKWLWTKDATAYSGGSSYNTTYAAKDADTVDGWHVVVGATGNQANTIYFA